MNQESLISRITNMVEEQCKSDTNIFGYEGWTDHITVVVKYSKLLAKELNADSEIVEIAALLHDYASVLDKELYSEHHIHGAIEAEKILLTYNYPKDKIERVKECIIEHRGSVVLEKTSRESICVASADAMFHIDNMPALLHLAYCNKGMETSEGAKWVRNKIERSWNKLCPEAKKIMKEKYDSVQCLLGKY